MKTTTPHQLYDHAMVKQFILQCLFFQSTESIHKVFGVLTWGCIFLFLYAVVNLWHSW